jgi:dinuclear metal center YbgI/SA1388 family protein
LEHDISLLAYHLPLDKHRVYGNNACLAEKLGFVVDSQDPQSLLWIGHLETPLSVKALSQHIGARLLRAPLHIAASSTIIETIGWCTGAAQSYIDRAADLGLDAYLSGEISEQTVHQAREYGVHYYAAGHHATERYGVQAFGQHLAQRFNLSFEFIDVDNPV